MGAMRNAVKRKTHKERAQPLARRRFGLLEKKKDYKLRANDFHKKEQTLQVLRRKAEEKNPDEFYFSMQNEATKDGVYTKPSAEANKYSQEQLRLMKTQDIKYIDLKAQAEAKKVQKLQERLHMVGSVSQSNHTVFVDNEEELRGFSAEEHFNTPSELLDRTFNRPREQQLREGSSNAGIPDLKTDARFHRYKAASYKELEQRIDRQEKLRSIASEMSHKKALMGKGSVRKLKPSEPGGKAVYKWRMIRKK